MIRFPGRRRVAAVILGLCMVAASFPAAAEPQGRLISRTGQYIVESPWSVFAGLWDFLSSLWSKNGGSPDPSGSPGSQPPGAGPKNGGSLDPSGNPGSQPSVPGSTSENGGSIDPNG